jgi:hypothetical protein
MMDNKTTFVKYKTEGLYRKLVHMAYKWWTNVYSIVHFLNYSKFYQFCIL